MEDFFRELEECLRGEVSEGEVRDSINYYRQYFAEQKAAGYGEKEILDMLGSPRLIARSIIDARGAVEQNDSGDGDPYYDAGQSSYSGTDDYYDSEGERYRYGEEPTHIRVKKVSGWKLVLLIIVVLIILAMLIRVLLPVVLVLIPVILILRLLKGDR